MTRSWSSRRWITVRCVALAVACAGCLKTAAPSGTGETNDAGGASGGRGGIGTAAGGEGGRGGAKGGAGSGGATTGAAGIGGDAGAAGAAGAGGTATGEMGRGGAAGADSAGTGGAAAGGAGIGGRGGGGSGGRGGNAGSGGNSAASPDAGVIDGGASCSLPSTVSFRRDVEPFLAAKCGGGNGCHVIDSASTMAAGGYDHAYDWITAGAHASSCPGTPTPKRFEVVLAVIAAANPVSCSRSRIMPPRDESGSNLRQPLTPCETAALKAWLEEPLVTQKHRVDDTDPDGTAPFPMPPFN